jgi:hypothetical protein
VEQFKLEQGSAEQEWNIETVFLKTRMKYGIFKMLL